MKDIHTVVRLLKNHLYPTYQLYAVMGNKKITSEQGLVLGALTVIDWVRQRLGEDIPEALKTPAPEEYANYPADKLISVHLNYGFVIDIVSLPEKGLWSLQITEPDLGSDPGNLNQKRRPIAGRVMETNVTFAIKGKELECGIQTLMSDPENTPLAEVYRPAFVKKLYNNPDFGLKHIIPLTPKLKFINSAESLKNVLQLYHNNSNQLPILIFTKVKKEEETEVRFRPVGMEELEKSNLTYDDEGNHKYDIKYEVKLVNKLEAKKGKVEAKKEKKPKEEEKITIRSIEELRILVDNPVALEKKPLLAQVKRKVDRKDYEQPPYDIYRWAGSFTGFAQVYLLEPQLLEQLNQQEQLNLKNGDVVVLEPQCFKGSKIIFSIGNAQNNSKLLQKFIFTYPREKMVDFGDITFLSGARDALVHSTMEAKEYSSEQEKRFAMQLSIKEAQWKAQLDEKNLALGRQESQFNKQSQQINILEKEKEALQKDCAAQLERQQAVLAEREAYIQYLEDRIKRPHTKKELPNWVETKLSKHLVLHPRAINELEAASLNEFRLELLYDALEYMGTDFWEARYAGLSEEELLKRSSRKYDRGFEITVNAPNSIRTYASYYKIPNYENLKGEFETRELSWHMKNGNNAEYLVRIYFFFDDERKLIVVGSLPDHLPTVTFG